MHIASAIPPNPAWMLRTLPIRSVFMAPAPVGVNRTTHEGFPPCANRSGKDVAGTSCGEATRRIGGTANRRSASIRGRYPFPKLPVLQLPLAPPAAEPSDKVEQPVLPTVLVGQGGIHALCQRRLRDD